MHHIASHLFCFVCPFFGFLFWVPLIPSLFDILYLYFRFLFFSLCFTLPFFFFSFFFLMLYIFAVAFLCALLISYA